MVSTVSVLSRTDTSVTLSWRLNKLVDVVVYYDTSTPIVPSSTTPSVKVSAFRFTSEVTIKGLQPQTTYYYLLVAENHFTPKTTSLTGTFTTRAS